MCQKVEATQLSTIDERVNKMQYIHTIKYNEDLKRKKCPHGLQQRNLNSILSEISESQRTNVSRLHLQEVPRGVKCIGAESGTVVTRGWWKGE
jgi:hypothetical protein